MRPSQQQLSSCCFTGQASSS